MTVETDYSGTYVYQGSSVICELRDNRYLRFRSNAGTLGLYYGLEQSMNLVSGSWETPGSGVVTKGTLGAGFDSITNRFQTLEANQEFIRLRIESN